MTIPNIITIARLLLVPVILLMIIEERWEAAFGLFVVAGVSDAVDGTIARRFDMRSRFGAALDPVADKLLLVTIYVALTIAGVIPAWLTALVVARDVLIVTAVAASWMQGRPLEIRPLLVSKLNTVAQVALAAAALAVNAFRIDPGPFEPLALGIAAALTVASAGAYLVLWLRHPAGRDGAKGAKAP
ncbi:MAG: CDP-alcohol phosphatidyltransferase family protein [Microvirga sp.]